jgi:conjugative transfer signal peptidase TraF
MRLPRLPADPIKALLQPFRLTLIGVVAMNLALFVVAGRTGAVAINHTTSLPPGIYIRDIHGDAPLHRGDIIAFCPPALAVAYTSKYNDGGDSLSVFCPDAGGESYLKTIAALPGDHVHVSRAGVSVNGGPILPGSLPLSYVGTKATDGHPITRVPDGSYVVPDGKVWAYTHQWYSFDSRYYGPVTPLHRMVPLWTIDMPTLATMPHAYARLQPKS